MTALDTARLQNLAAALTQDKAALEAQGVTVPEGTLHDGIPALISQIRRIEIRAGSITPTENTTNVTLDAPANAKAIYFEAEDEETVKAAGANYAIAGRASWMQEKQAKFHRGVYSRWNGSDYTTSTWNPQFSEQKVSFFPPYPLAAGVKYNYWIYGWDEEATAVMAALSADSRMMFAAPAARNVEEVELPECTNPIHSGG